MAGAVTENQEQQKATTERDNAEAGAAKDATAESQAQEKLKNLSISDEKTDDSSTGSNNVSGDAEDSMESYIKHPLQNSWCLWFLSNDKKLNWEDRLINITTVDTVEDFWSVYNHIKTPSELQSGHDYNLFKNDIKPMWEHKANAKGGKLEIMFDRRPKQNDLDKAWLDTMLLLIGEGFEDADEINGVVASIRNKQDKLAIWLANKNNTEAIKNIEARWRSHLQLKSKKIAFHVHDTNAH